MSNEFSVPQPKQRPGVVTVGGFTQYVVLGLAALYCIAGLVQATPVIDAASQALRQEDSIPTAETDTAITVMYLFGYGVVLVVPLYALTVAIMGIFVLQGRNGARITTWVLAGGGLCCSGLSALSLPFAGTDPTSQVQFGGEDELSRTMEQAVANADIPAWTTPVSIVTTILATVAFLLIIILLALPAANDYFRKPPPQDIPPAAFPG